MLFFFFALVLQIDNKHEKALGRKVKAMCSLGQFSEAQSLAYQWIHRDPTVSIELTCHLLSIFLVYCNSLFASLTDLSLRD